MSEFWTKAFFFFVVLAPIWGIFLMMLSEMFNNQTVKVALQSLFGFIALQTFFLDLIFLFILAVLKENAGTAFVDFWYWLFTGGGVVWWACSLSGYILATLRVIFTDDDSDTYIKNCFLLSLVSLVIYFLILFLLSVSNLLVIPQ